MGYFTNEIQTVNMDGMSGFERIDGNLRALIASVEGTIPGSRGFGLPAGITDMNPDRARNDLAEALDEKTERFIPEIRIASLDCDMDLSGVLKAKIFIEPNDGLEEEGDD
ncbi:MAG: hypothetical protein IJS41_03780 [Clostridia bacterium]|nr:hypothetical protein [Clostridia bacterium]